MPKQLFITTYGCQMNEYDSAKIADLMAEAQGFVVSDNPKNADLVILNTCSVRAKAEEKMFSELGRLRLLKKHKPQLVIAVGGCVAVQEQKTIFSRAPYVDIVFGPQTLHRLPEMYLQALEKKRVIDISFPQIEKFDYFPEPHTSGPTAFVSIMEGCNKFCSYCIVPFTRGREVSRPKADILDEITKLAAHGVKEIHLLGQNVNAYRDGETRLSDLIKATAQIETIKRIRFTTSHPAEFGDDLVAVFASEPKLVSHLHLPIQSGSDRILNLMRRGYTAEDFKLLVAKIRQARPNISLSSDFIVGFPGETEEDFAATMQIIREVNFDNSFSFIYSPRPKTQAIKLEDDVPLEEKKRRLMILQTQIAAQARAYSKAMVGTTQQVLVLGPAKKDSQQFSGRTENNRVVNFSSDHDITGELVAVKITAALPNSLRGV